jgi:hypothetical protein
MVSQKVRLIDEHARIEVEWGRRAHLSRPLHLLRALLAVPNIILRRIAPCLLTKAIHHSIKVPIQTVIKEVINIFKHLDITVQVDHLVILHELQNSNQITDSYL